MRKAVNANIFIFSLVITLLFFISFGINLQVYGLKVYGLCWQAAVICSNRESKSHQ